MVLIAFIAGILIALPLAWYGGTAGAVWGAAIIVVTAGGGIAYLGDVIGYSLGKKRVTLFKLRPRDTAKLVGIVAGALSALAAGIFLLTIDAEFQQALFKGHELMHSLVTMHRQNTALERRIGQSSLTLQTAERDKLQAQKEQAAARTDLEVAKRDLNKTRIAFIDANKALATETASLKIAQNNLQNRQADLDRATRAIKNAQLQYNAIETAIKAEAGATITIERSSELVYRNGQEVGRCVVHKGPRAVVVKKLEEFLDALSKSAGAAGAGRDGYSRAVKLATIQIKPKGNRKDTTSDPSSFIDETESINALADQISISSSESVVVLANAVGNSFARMPVVLQLRPYRNRLAIAAGTVLAETTIHTDESADPGEIINLIQKLLTTKVRPAAMASGVIPALESASSEAKFGDLSIGDLLRVVLETKAVKGDATIKAVAATDIWSGDRLQLRFNVTPGPHEP